MYSSGMSTTSQGSGGFDGTGRSAVVTGGSRGIGLAIADALLGAGVSVTITGRSREHLDEARRTLLAADASREPRLLLASGDVSDAGDAAEAIAAASRQFGGLDILINNAGVGAFAPVGEMTVEDWQQVIGTNLSGVFYCCHAAIPELKKRGGGWIINISSLAGKNSFAGGAAYCASKAGLNAFSESLMQDVRYDGIRVSYIMPGSVATEFMGRGAAKNDWATQAEDVAQVVLDLLAMPERSLPSRVELRPSRPPKK